MSKHSTRIKNWHSTPEKMDERINRLKTMDDCQIFSKNVTALGFPELATRAERRGVELQAATHDVKDQTERSAFEAIYAYELVLRKNAGKKVRATGIWNMVKRHGVVETIQRSINGPPNADHFETLKAIGLDDLAFESIVIKHKNRFAPTTVERASTRLAEWT